MSAAVRDSGDLHPLYVFVLTDDVHAEQHSKRFEEAQRSVLKTALREYEYKSGSHGYAVRQYCAPSVSAVLKQVQDSGTPLPGAQDGVIIVSTAHAAPLDEPSKRLLGDDVLHRMFNETQHIDGSTYYVSLDPTPRSDELKQQIDTHMKHATGQKVAGNMLYKRRDYKGAIRTYSETLRFIAVHIPCAKELIYDLYMNRCRAFTQLGMHHLAYADAALIMQNGTNCRKTMLTLFRCARRVQEYETARFVASNLMKHKDGPPSPDEAAEFMQLMKEHEAHKAKVKKLKEQFKAGKGDLRVGGIDPSQVPEWMKEKLAISETLYHFTADYSTLQLPPALKPSELSLPATVKISTEGSTAGYGMFATTECKSGEILASEEPALFAVADCKLQCSCCGKALAKVALNFQCFCDRQCANERYCSTGCRDRAWSMYHAIQCKHGWDFSDPIRSAAEGCTNTSRFPLLNLRAMGMALQQGLFSPADLPVVRTLRVGGSFSKDGGCDFVSMLSWWDKQRNAMKLPLSQTIRFDFQLFIYLIDLWSTNGFANSIVKGKGEMTNALCMYKMCTFINHSCAPNANWSFNDGTIQLQLLRKVKAGEELFVSYLSSFTMPYEERAMRLQQYGIVCQCELCKVQRPAQKEKEKAENAVGSITHRVTFDRYCEHCGKLTKLRCSVCRRYYCNDTCAQKDQDEHILVCRPVDTGEMASAFKAMGVGENEEWLTPQLSNGQSFMCMPAMMKDVLNSKNVFDIYQDQRPECQEFARKDADRRAFAGMCCMMVDDSMCVMRTGRNSKLMEALGKGMFNRPAPSPSTSSSQTGPSCVVCHSSTTTRCNGCKAVHYCSKQCQTSDWKKHKPACKYEQHRCALTDAFTEKLKLYAGCPGFGVETIVDHEKKMYTVRVRVQHPRHTKITEQFDFNHNFATIGNTAPYGYYDQIFQKYINKAPEMVQEFFNSEPRPCEKCGRFYDTVLRDTCPCTGPRFTRMHGHAVTLSADGGLKTVAPPIMVTVPHNDNPPPPPAPPSPPRAPSPPPPEQCHAKLEFDAGLGMTSWYHSLPAERQSTLQNKYIEAFHRAESQGLRHLWYGHAKDILRCVEIRRASASFDDIMRLLEVTPTPGREEFIQVLKDIQSTLVGIFESSVNEGDRPKEQLVGVELNPGPGATEMWIKWWPEKTMEYIRSLKDSDIGPERNIPLVTATYFVLKYPERGMSIKIGSLGLGMGNDPFYEFGGKSYTTLEQFSKNPRDWDAYAWAEDAEGRVYDAITKCTIFPAMLTGKTIGYKEPTLLQGTLTKQELAETKGLHYIEATPQLQTQLFVRGAMCTKLTLENGIGYKTAYLSDESVDFFDKMQEPGWFEKNKEAFDKAFNQQPPPPAPPSPPSAPAPPPPEKSETAAYEDVLCALRYPATFYFSRCDLPILTVVAQEVYEYVHDIRVVPCPDVPPPFHEIFEITLNAPGTGDGFVQALIRMNPKANWEEMAPKCLQFMVKQAEAPPPAPPSPPSAPQPPPPGFLQRSAQGLRSASTPSAPQPPPPADDVDIPLGSMSDEQLRAAGARMGVRVCLSEEEAYLHRHETVLMRKADGDLVLIKPLGKAPPADSPSAPAFWERVDRVVDSVPAEFRDVTDLYTCDPPSAQAAPPPPPPPMPPSPPPPIQNSGPQNMQEAYNMMQQRGFHLLGTLTCTPLGEMHYEGFVPLDTVVSALGINVDDYLPDAKEKEALRAGKKTTAHLSARKEQWFEIMKSQVTWTTVAGRPVMNIPTTYHQQERVRTFSLEPPQQTAPADTPLPSPCANCLAPNATKFCSQCKAINYCSRDCQAQHWRKRHKGMCPAMREDPLHVFRFQSEWRDATVEIMTRITPCAGYYPECDQFICMGRVTQFIPVETWNLYLPHNLRTSLRVNPAECKWVMAVPTVVFDGTFVNRKRDPTGSKVYSMTWLTERGPTRVDAAPARDMKAHINRTMGTIFHRHGATCFAKVDVDFEPGTPQWDGYIMVPGSPETGPTGPPTGASDGFSRFLMYHDSLPEPLAKVQADQMRARRVKFSKLAPAQAQLANSVVEASENEATRELWNQQFPNIDFASVTERLANIPMNAPASAFVEAITSVATPRDPPPAPPAPPAAPSPPQSFSLFRTPVAILVVSSESNAAELAKTILAASPYTTLTMFLSWQHLTPVVAPTIQEAATRAGVTVDDPVVIVHPNTLSADSQYEQINQWRYASTKRQGVSTVSMHAVWDMTMPKPQSSPSAPLPA